MLARPWEIGTSAPARHASPAANENTASAASPPQDATAGQVAPFYPPESGPGWTRLGLTTAHATMVVRVTIDPGADPMAIARAIVTPLEPNYTEILVYFHPPHSEMPLRRIQWTPRQGFVEMTF